MSSTAEMRERIERIAQIRGCSVVDAIYVVLVEQQEQIAGLKEYIDALAAVAVLDENVTGEPSSTAPNAEDWAAHDVYSESTIECQCGQRFKSHSKFKVGEGIVTRKPCPRCYATAGMRAARSEESEF